MLATSGPQWFDRRRRDSPWASFGISVAITAAVFAGSFASMNSISLWIDRAANASPPVMVPLPPLPKPAPKPRTPPADTRPRPVAPTTVPSEIASPVSTIPVAPPAIAPIVSPTPAVPRTDTATARAAQPLIPHGIIAAPRMIGAFDSAAAGAAVGAATAGVRAGVSYDSRAQNTMAVRDSMIRGKLSDMAELLRTHPMKGAELAELKQSQAEAGKLARRATTAGNADVHVMSGEGMGGVGAVGGGQTVTTGANGAMVSIPFPLFSMGPSAEQRKRNEKIDAENQLRLRGFADLIRAKKDSVRADSLRRDSLARRRVVP